MSPPKIPFSLPFFGHVLYIFIFSDRFIDWCTKTYGELFDIDLMSKTITVAAGQCALEVMKADHHVLSLPEGTFKDMLYFDYACDHLAFDVLVEGVPRILRRAIHKSKMPEYTECMIVHFNRTVDCFLPHTDTAILEDPKRFFQELTINMGTHCLLGREMETDSALVTHIHHFFTSIMQNADWLYALPQISHGILKPFLHDARYYRKLVDIHLFHIIHRRQAKMAKAAAQEGSYTLEGDLLQGLLEYTKLDGTRYSDEQLVQGLTLVLFAAIHTTSLNMAMAFYWLLSRPDLKERLELEIKESVGDGEVSEKTLDEMQFLDSFLHATLHHSQDVLNIGKKALQDYTFFNGYHVPKGRTIKTTNQHLNLGPKAGVPTAEKLKPLLIRKHPLTTPAKDFVTFGMGKNVCPGRFMAVQQIKIALILLLQKYDITTVSGRVPQPIHYRGGIMAEACNEPLLLKKKK
ncbi:hypothetical protein EC973_004371 [Apophysomyces ossiformis]|uniref:Cytochrome P450 n=1 Tax=Apophysomyces ossiformis TaxID=679940 RepID=A0A8H7BGW1_9FUNG|nr:hypothetical protein EC973_004371 [Apophysomyces ossiformis]